MEKKNKSSKSKVIISVSLIGVVIIALVGGGLVSSNKNKELEEITNNLVAEVNSLVDSGDFKGAIDLINSNTEVSSSTVFELLTAVEKQLYDKSYEEITVYLNETNFTLAKEKINSLNGYLDETVLKSLTEEIESKEYNNNIYLVGSFIYTLNLAKELEMGLSDIVYKNYDLPKEQRLKNNKEETELLKEYSNYINSLYVTLYGKPMTTAQEPTTQEPTTQETTTQEPTTQEPTTEIEVKDEVVILDNEVTQLLNNLVNSFIGLSDSLIGDRIVKKDYLKTLEIYSTEFDLTLNKILVKNKQVADCIKKIEAKEINTYVINKEE